MLIEVSVESILKLQQENIWLGGLFTPEAYITATKQYVAKVRGWSLEQLTMKMSVMENQADTSETNFVIIGTKAVCKSSFITTSSNLTIQTNFRL
jgi:dynein heavy chain 1